MKLSEPRVILGLGKGVFDMVDLFHLTRTTLDLYLDDIKAGLQIALRHAQIVGSGAHDMELLALIDGVLSAQIGACGAGLDLDKDDLVFIDSNDIDLAELVFIILFQNFIPLLLQISRGELLAQNAESLIGADHLVTFG